MGPPDWDQRKNEIQRSQCSHKDQPETHSYDHNLHLDKSIQLPVYRLMRIENMTVKSRQEQLTVAY